MLSSRFIYVVRTDLKNRKNENFEVIVEEYTSRIYSTCFHFLHNREDAEDVTQDVFLQAFSAWESYRGEAQVQTWLNRIAVNLCLNFIRRKKRLKRFGQFKRILGFGNSKTGEEVIAVQGNPETDLDKKEQRMLLNQSMAKLPENQRMALTLNKYDGYTHQEVAEILGTTVSAVESLLHRGKKNLSKHLIQLLDE